MAFTYAILGTRSVGGAHVQYGTWSAASATVGVIPFCSKRDSAEISLTTTSTTSATITTSGSYATSGIAVGDVITGAEIVNGTYVESIESATSLTMSKASTASGGALARTFMRLSTPTNSIITAKVISSTSAVTMTAARVRSVNNTISLTCVSDDAGYWSVWCH